MVSTFRAPSKIITGVGAIEKAGSEAVSFGSRALLVTGLSAMRRAGITERLVKALKGSGVEVTLFEKVEAEPSVDTVDLGRHCLKESSSEVVIGLGGGSALDVAKAIAGLGRSEALTREFQQGKALHSIGLPFIAIPTTSGTGSEATEVSVLTDPLGKLKRSIRGEALMPKLAIVDPSLTLGVPPAITACTGMDALTQALESFLSIYSTPITEALSLEAVRLVSQNLIRAYKDGGDLEARSALAYGSLMAGMALQNARLGVVHGLAHPVGGKYSIPHGLACAVLLPQALQLNRDAVPEKLERVKELLGEDPITFTWRLLEELNIPLDFGEYQLREEDFPKIVEETLSSGSTKSNPRKVTADDVLRILKKVRGKGD